MKKREQVLLGSLCALLPVSLVLVLWARSHPSQVERLYSLEFYPRWSALLMGATAHLPFSLAEWLILAAVVLVVFFAVRYAVRMAGGRGRRLELTKAYALRALAAASLVLFLFLLGGGLNYYRYSFTYYTGLEVRESEVTQLRDLCLELADDANTLREGLPEDADGVFTLADVPVRTLSATARDQYAALARRNPRWTELLEGGGGTAPKGVLFSEAMSYMQIVGVFFPFTMEANVNVHTSPINIPFAMCHELSHISGFMREDEANYLAYLACMAGDSREFAYSGAVEALVHASNALYRKNARMYDQVMEGLSDGVRRDLAADAAYYDAHKSALGDFSQSVNDAYLRVNNQTDGVYSYGRMVDLMLADYRLRHGAA